MIRDRLDSARRGRAVTGRIGLAAIAAAVACGGRDDTLDAPFEASEAVGLERAVAIGDGERNRVVLLTSPSPRELAVTALPVGENRLAMVPSVDGDGLLVLSSGERPRRNADDELPSLTLIDASAEPSIAARYPLPDAFSTLTLDPTGRWVVLSGAGDNFVSNPNQLVLVDLSDPDFEPITKTIRSFGAAPERFQFTEPLDVPGGEERRFLIVESRQDITLVDLGDLDRPEITVPLPLTPSGAPGRPLQVVAHAGEPDVAEDAQIAIRLDNDPNLVLVNFIPSDNAALAFNLTLNLVDVGGPPAAVDFVTTDSGLRLAAVVPARTQANLVHPLTTGVERVALPARFDRFRRVTEGALADEPGDVALLWSQSTSMVGFWSLGRTSGQAFRSVDTVNLETNVSQLFDVPGSALGHRKLLQSPDNRFFVLDLRSRQSFPMFASGRNLSLRVAPDGLRAWAFAAGSPLLAKVDLQSLEPTSLEIERGIRQLFDIETLGGDGRALIALHDGGGRGATLLDAENPDTADSRFFPGLLLRER